MKICWDNLEKLTYHPGFGCWMNKWYTRVVYVDSCKYCGDPFLAFRTDKGEYCCAKCQAKDVWDGKTHTKEARKKMSEAKKGKYCGKDHPMWGKNHSKESRKKMSESHIGIQEGESSPSWKGGYAKRDIPMYDTYAPQIDYVDECRRDPEDENVLQVRCCVCNKWYTPKIMDIYHRKYTLTKKDDPGEFRFYCSTECKNACSVYQQKTLPKGFREPYRTHQKVWANMVKERAGYKCEICGKSNCKLIAHHFEGIEQNPIISADIDAGICLCEECHKRAHSSHGCRPVDLQRC